MTSRLSAVVVRPEESAWERVELKLLVDGRDVIGPVFDKGPWKDPDVLVGRLLCAGEVMLAEARCSWGCCGAIFVRVSRDGGEVVWDQWRNPDDGGLSLPTIRFDAAQYEAELARVDRSWEWPGRTIARLVRAGADVFDRWNCSLDEALSFPDHRDRVRVTFTSPPRAADLIDHVQYLRWFPVTDEPADRQAERILATLRANDPRKNAEVCGGHKARRT